MSIRKVFRFVLSHKFGCCVVAFLVYMAVGCDYSLLDIYRLHREERSLRRQIATYRDSIDSFERYIDEVSGNPQELERYAREHMLMHAPDEDVYLIK